MPHHENHVALLTVDVCTWIIPKTMLVYMTVWIMHCHAHWGVAGVYISVHPYITIVTCAFIGILRSRQIA